MNVSVLLAGCGDIAQRLALLLQQDFHWVGLRRHPHNFPAHITPLPVDITHSAALSSALQQHVFDYVVITLTPGERSEARYRQIYINGVRHLLQALRGSPRIVFVSSTSVYEQDAGEWVDEHTPALGRGFSGRCLLEAEAQINTSTFVSTVVRFSGIYGAERGRLLRQVQEGCVDITQAAQWTNRIHADDCARVLAHLLCRWQRGETVAPCYVATDDCPVQAGEVWQWLAAQLAVRDPLLDVDWHSAVASGKRCSNALLRREGFVFSSPDYRAGYQSLLGKTV